MEVHTDKIIRVKQAGTFIPVSDYLVFRIEDGAEFSFETAVRLHRGLHEFENIKKVFVYADRRTLFSCTKEGLNYLVHRTLKENLSAISFYGMNLHSKLIMNNFINSNRSETHMKLFENEKEAVDWLLGFQV